MILHDKNLLNNLALVEEAETLQNGGFISKEQTKIIKNALPSFRSQSNILVRLGFFLLGSFLYLSICGAISLIGLSGEDFYFKICCYLFAGVGIIGAEFLANQKYYRHGLDDAFILGILLNIGFAIAITTEGYEIIIAVFVAITSFLTYRRYLHLLSMLVFCLASSAVLFFGMFEIGDIGKTILPFVAMLASAGIYFFTKNRIKSLTKWYYYNGLLLANSFCLILFYLSCNYLVVRELSFELLGVDVLPGQDISFAFFFYAFTFIVPIVYLVQALKIKDRIMLWISFAAIGFSIFTIRFYYSVLPIEVALTFGGLVLFVIAYFSIQKLKNKEEGLTFKPDRINNSNAILNAEALIVASTFGMKPEVKTDSPMDFGGGGFSGGGSGGSF
ncbi:hypothetical protein B0A75_18785 [Flavobacterium oncorhynchi]|uniref:DUF2157 domain-containing protein n=1 Tax=Flavobacterium oncorhynchi TaxID=728056 RepID=A0A226HNM8_9FLAO|nr:hypothetical protein [Flavobacterium oncorhynchi]OXA95714.1 hypothetical protein B0A75_18785 [Flavobacterium oncorhynchi]